MGRFWVKDRVEERSFVSLYYETPSITDNMAHQMHHHLEITLAEQTYIKSAQPNYHQTLDILDKVCS